MPDPNRPALSPPAAAIVRAMRTARPSRRSVFGAAAALGLGAAVTACGTGSSGSAGSAASAGSAGDRPSPAKDVSDTEKLVRWANWTLYLDKNQNTNTYPTLDTFQARTGIKATYAEDIEDNDTYYAQIQAQLREGVDIGKDVIVLTDWMAGRLVRNGWTQRLDKATIPNAANILDRLRTVDYDPGRHYSLTWQSGYTGLGWNTARLQEATGRTELKTLDDLWDPRLHGRIEVLSEMRDTIGLILMSQGVAVDRPFSRDQFDTAVSVLEKQLAIGQIRQVQGNSYKQDLVSGDAIAVIGWSGDVLQLNTEAKSTDPTAKDPYGFAIPAEGGMMWSDNLLIPIGSPHRTNAELLMNYYYDPKVAAQVAAYVNYICPVKGAQAEIVKLPNVTRDIANSPYIFPTAEQLAKVHFFRSLSATEEKDFNGAFLQILGA